MTKSGSTVPANYLEFKEQVVELRYKKGKKQTEIARELGFPSKHAVSQILQAHEDDMIKSFKKAKLNPNTKKYVKELNIIVSFLREKRGYDYAKISKLLGLEKETMCKSIRTVDSGVKVRASSNNAERNKRIQQFIDMNLKEGLSVTEIAARVGLSKQRISAMFKKVGYEPQSGANLWSLRASMNAPDALKMALADYNRKIEGLNAKYTRVQIDFGNLKYHTSKVMTELRCDIVEMYLDNPTPEHRHKYLIARKAIRQYSLKGSKVGTSPLAERIIPLLSKADKYEESLKN